MTDAVTTIIRLRYIVSNINNALIRTILYYITVPYYTVSEASAETARGLGLTDLRGGPWPCFRNRRSERVNKLWRAGALRLWADDG